MDRLQGQTSTNNSFELIIFFFPPYLKFGPHFLYKGVQVSYYITSLSVTRLMAWLFSTWWVEFEIFPSRFVTACILSSKFYFETIYNRLSHQSLCSNWLFGYTEDHSFNSFKIRIEIFVTYLSSQQMFAEDSLIFMDFWNGGNLQEFFRYLFSKIYPVISTLYIYIYIYIYYVCIITTVPYLRYLFSASSILYVNT